MGTMPKPGLNVLNQDGESVEGGLDNSLQT